MAHYPVSAAFKGEEERVRAKRSKTVWAGWKLKDAEVIKFFQMRRGT